MDDLLLHQNASWGFYRTWLRCSSRRVYQHAWKSCINDWIYDLCCSSLFWYLCPGSGCRCRAYYKSNDGLPVIPYDGTGCPLHGIKGRCSRSGVLLKTWFWKNGRCRTRKFHFCGYGTVLLYIKYRYRCVSYFRKLYWKRTPSDRRSHQYHHSGYTGCIYGWSDHFPGMFCIWSWANFRSIPDLYHVAKCN